MILLACLLLLQGEGTPPEKHEVAGLRYRAWLANLGGTVHFDRPAVEGTDVRYIGDLDLDQIALFHDLGGWVRLGDDWDVRLEWVFGTFEGSQTLDQTVRFAGKSYSKGSAIQSEVSSHMVTGLVEYRLWGPEDLGAEAEIWLQAGGKFVRSSTTIASSFATSEGTLTGILPVIGLRGGIAFSELFRADLQMNGLYFPGGDQELRLFDVTVEVGVTPWEGLLAGVGFRLVDAYARDETDPSEKEVSDIALYGVYFFVGWRF